MSEEAVPVRNPIAADAKEWAMEVATAIEAVHEERPLRLEDGALLEPEDGRDAVVLAAIAARGIDATVDDITDLVEILAEVDNELEDDDDDVATITIRYLGVHSALDLIEDPTPELVAEIVAETTQLLTK